MYTHGYLKCALLRRFGAMCATMRPSKDCPVKSLKIVLASPESMDGHTIAVHLGDGKITAVVDRTHVDPAIIAPAEEAIRFQLGDAIRLQKPLPSPFLPVQMIPDIKSVGYDIQVTPYVIVERFPKDCASERIVEEARLLGDQVMRWYALPSVIRKRMLIARMQAESVLAQAV